MVDIHCHLLPGFDDGPGTVEESVELAKNLYAVGVRTVVAAVHIGPGQHQPPIDEVKERAAILGERLVTQGVPLDITWAAEIPLAEAEGMSREELASCSVGGYGRHVLVAPSELTSVRRIEDALFRVRLQGFRTILAHPERVPLFQRLPEAITESVRCGVLVEVSAGSLLGREGLDQQRAVRAMLGNGHVHFIGSGSHDANGRYYNLAEARRVAASVVGRPDAEKLVEANPRAVLRPGSSNSVSAARPRKRFLGIF